jgi:hypothetical protein
MPIEAAKRPPRRPFKGRPQRIHLASTFLPTPDSDGHLDDWSTLSAAKRFDDDVRHSLAPPPAVHGGARFRGSLESFMRSVLRTANEPGRGLNPTQLARFRELLPSTGAPPELELLLSALGGDHVSIEEFAARGDWVVMRGVMLPITPSWTHPKLDLYSEIHIACRPVDAHMVAERYSDAADAIVADDSLRPYFSQAGLAQLKASQTVSEAKVAQIFALCELQVAAIARVACQSTFAAGDDIAQLVETPVGREVAPGRQFVRWLMRQAGVATLKGLVDLVALHSPHDAPRLSEASVKRWSAGSEFPSKQAMDAVGDALFCSTQGGGRIGLPEGELPEVFQRGQPIMWAARRLYKAQQLLELVGAGLAAEGLGGLVPGFLGAADVSEWASTRFEFWRTHWR